MTRNLLWPLLALSGSTLLQSPASAQFPIPPGSPAAARQAGVNAAFQTGRSDLLADINSGRVTIQLADIPPPGASRNDGQGSGQILVKVGLSPEKQTAVILHEYHHILNSHSPGNADMCEELSAIQAAATALVDASSNPLLSPPFQISCALKGEMFNNATWADFECNSPGGTPPSSADAYILGPVFLELPCN